MSELTGKVAIVTGAASGIGRAIAADLARAGAAVVVADVQRSEQAADEIARESTGDVVGVDTDVSSERATSNMAAVAVRQFGGVDILVNNAALFSPLIDRPFEEIPTEEWQRVLQVNVLGSHLCAKAVVGSMRRRGGGAIVNISSGTVFKGTPRRLHYVTSKGAVIAFTRALARELGTDNIRVNAIAPGFTESDGVLAHGSAYAENRRMAPLSRCLPRPQEPADLVGAVRFLCGPNAAFITGQTLVVDGGSVLH